MQVPLWLFLSTVLFLLTWQDMASLVLRRVPANAVSSFINKTAPPRRIIPALLSYQQPQRQSQSSFSTTSSNMSETDSAPFLEAIKSRRSLRSLENTSPISDSKTQGIVEHAILHTPSAFNSQSSRLVILYKEEHRKLWEITKETLKAIVPADQWEASEKRLNAFQNSYGTILFFVDRPTVKDLQSNMPTYADRIPTWAYQSDGMHQLVLWTALEKEGLGANLQHYNPLIDEKVIAEWGLSTDWELTAQLVFGTPLEGPGEKTFLDLKDRLKVFGA